MSLMLPISRNYTRHRFDPNIKNLVSLLLACVVLAFGGRLARAGLFVSVNEFTGAFPNPIYVAEYSTTGSRIQTLPSVPFPGGDSVSEHALRDLVVGPDNSLYVYNGTFTPTLARYDFGKSTWSQMSFNGWSTVNNGTYGGLSSSGRYVYATDMDTFGAASQGIVRFDTQGGATIRLANSIQPNDLAIGLNGVAYMLDGSGSPRDTVYQFDLNTLAPLASISVAFADHRAIAIAPDGSFFLADWEGVIRRYSPSGVLIDSLYVPGALFSDIDISADGELALGTGFVGEVILTDVNLDSFTRFQATDSDLGGETFVTWSNPVAIPEPSSFVTLLMTGCFYAGTWMCRRKQAR